MGNCIAEGYIERMKALDILREGSYHKKIGPGSREGKQERTLRGLQ